MEAWPSANKSQFRIRIASIHRGELPAGKPILAAYHFEIMGNIGGCQGLDLPALLGLNKDLDMFHIPAPLLLRYGSFLKAEQIVRKEPRSGVRGIIRDG